MKAELARKLSKVEGFEDPRISLEQYVTPPELAADILHSADMHGDLEGRKVLDLGTGTGIFAIGAALLGAEVTAVEKDGKALNIARENAEKLEVADFIDFQERDVEKVDASSFTEEAALSSNPEQDSAEGEFDTVVMNPPFSVHSEEGFKFLEKALNSAEAVYTISHPGMRSRIKEFVAKSEHRIEAFEEYTVSLPPTYGFHTQDERETKVDVLVTR